MTTTTELYDEQYYLTHLGNVPYCYKEPWLSIADAVASLYDMSLTGNGIDAKPLQRQTHPADSVVEAVYVDYEAEYED